MPALLTRATDNVFARVTRQVCIGCNNGELVVVSCDGGGGVYTLESTVQAHTGPLSFASSDYHDSRGTRAGPTGPGADGGSRTELVTVDVDGNLVLWSCLSGKDFVKKCTHTLSRADEEGSSVGSADRTMCCVSVCVRGPWIICGMATGEVMCLVGDENDATSLRPLWCVVAHSRYLSCMSMHPFQDVLATAAEEGTVCIWQLHVKNTGAADEDQDAARVVDVLHSSRWDDVMITGVSFSGNTCDRIAMVAYDERSMKVIKWE